MGIVENVGAVPPPGWLKPAVYALSVVGLGLGLVAAIIGDPIGAALVLATPPVTLGLAASAPQIFEIRRRGGGRGFNPLLGGGVLGAILAALGPHLFGPQSQLIGAAAGALAGLGAALATPGRAALAGPIQYVALMSIFGALYGAAAVTVVDVRFDRAPAQVFRTTITDKYETHGKSTGYYLDIPPWGPQTHPSSVQVPSRLYDAVQEGDPICMSLHPGLLGAPWYDVAQCGPAPAAGSAA